MRRNSILLFLCALISLAVAASPPSFCKCTCFTNSTIIPLAQHESSSSSSSSSKSSDSSSLRNLFTRASSTGTGCALCNRAFCLSYNLPICKNAEETDVFTTCFQRDSRKDQIIVLLFIAATLGLLGWAGLQWGLEKKNKGLREGSSGPGLSGAAYAPVGEGDAR